MVGYYRELIGRTILKSNPPLFRLAEWPPKMAETFSNFVFHSVYVLDASLSSVNCRRLGREQLIAPPSGRHKNYLVHLRRIRYDTVD